MSKPAQCPGCGLWYGAGELTPTCAHCQLANSALSPEQISSLTTLVLLGGPGFESAEAMIRSQRADDHGNLTRKAASI